MNSEDAQAHTDAKKRFGDRIKSAGRQLVEDPDVQAGVAQVVMALAALAVRALRANDSEPTSAQPG